MALFFAPGDTNPSRLAVGAPMPPPVVPLQDYRPGDLSHLGPIPGLHIPLGLQPRTRLADYGGSPIEMFHPYGGHLQTAALLQALAAHLIGQAQGHIWAHPAYPEMTPGSQALLTHLGGLY